MLHMSVGGAVCGDPACCGDSGAGSGGEKSCSVASRLKNKDINPAYF